MRLWAKLRKNQPNFNSQKSSIVNSVESEIVPCHECYCQYLRPAYAILFEYIE